MSAWFVSISRNVYAVTVLFHIVTYFGLSIQNIYSYSCIKLFALKKKKKQELWFYFITDGQM